jgi:hypothetical protein
MSCVPGLRFRVQEAEHLAFAWMIVSRWMSPSKICPNMVMVQSTEN